MKLFEIATPDFDNEKFEDDCSYYIEQMGSKIKNLRMYRGSSTNDAVINKIKPFRPRAHSNQMPPGIHKALNELFANKFNRPFRNGLFTTGSKGTASGYGEGNPKIIVPVGKFEWLCCPDIHDIYGEYMRIQDNYGHERGVTDIMKMAETAQWKHNTNLPACLLSRAEIMLWCPGGYYVFGDLSSATGKMFLPDAIS
jgi:hypothetical protein